MWEAKPFENTSIFSSRRASVRVRNRDGGSGCGIRTHGTVPRSVLFKSTALSHSANPPHVAASDQIFTEQA